MSATGNLLTTYTNLMAAHAAVIAAVVPPAAAPGPHWATAPVLVPPATAAQLTFAAKAILDSAKNKEIHYSGEPDLDVIDTFLGYHATQARVVNSVHPGIDDLRYLIHHVPPTLSSDLQQWHVNVVTRIMFQAAAPAAPATVFSVWTTSFQDQFAPRNISAGFRNELQNLALTDSLEGYIARFLHLMRLSQLAVRINGANMERVLTDHEALESFKTGLRRHPRYGNLLASAMETQITLLLNANQALPDINAVVQYVRTAFSAKGLTNQDLAATAKKEKGEANQPTTRHTPYNQHQRGGGNQRSDTPSAVNRRGQSTPSSHRQQPYPTPSSSQRGGRRDVGRGRGHGLGGPPRRPVGFPKPSRNIMQCERCGRENHNTSQCFARYHQEGYALEGSVQTIQNKNIPDFLGGWSNRK